MGDRKFLLVEERENFSLPQLEKKERREGGNQSSIEKKTKKGEGLLQSIDTREKGCVGGKTVNNLRTKEKRTRFLIFPARREEEKKKIAKSLSPIQNTKEGKRSSFSPWGGRGEGGKRRKVGFALVGYGERKKKEESNSCEEGRMKNVVIAGQGGKKKKKEGPFPIVEKKE